MFDFLGVSLPQKAGKDLSNNLSRQLEEKKKEVEEGEILFLNVMNIIMINLHPYLPNLELNISLQLTTID